MSQTGDAAEQIVNMAANVTVKGIEMVTNIAGKGAISLATFLAAALKDQKRTKGKARMQAFNGKPTKVFVIKNSELKRFAEEAKKYGVLYAAVVNRKQPDGVCDIVVNANDAAKVNRIAERFALSTVDVEKIRADIEKTRLDKQNAQKERTTPPAEKEAAPAEEKILNGVSSQTPKQTTHKQPAGIIQNPTKAKTEKSSPSEPLSKNKGDIEKDTIDKPSVKQQINEIKAERRDNLAKKAPEKALQTTHKRPVKSKKPRMKGR